MFIIINHLFGPSSLEAEENQRRLDRTLAELFRFIDKKVGLANSLVVLSGDHGSPEVPGYLKEFGIGEELIQTYFHPYLYLNRELIRRRGLDQGEVERAVAAELVKFPGVALAVSSVALLEGDVPDTWQPEILGNQRNLMVNCQ